MQDQVKHQKIGININTVCKMLYYQKMLLNPTHLSACYMSAEVKPQITVVFFLVLIWKISGMKQRELGTVPFSV